MSKCQVDSLGTTLALLAEVKTILHDMMTVERFALDVTTAKGALIDRCELVKKTMDDVISRYQTISEVTSQPSVSNGSDAFMWTCQQLLSTDWSGPPKTSSSFIKWEIVGKPGTSEGFGLKSLGSATPPATSTNASTCTTREALKALNKAIMEAQEAQARYDDQRP